MVSPLEESIKISTPPVAPCGDIHCLIIQISFLRFAAKEMPADAMVVRLASLLVLWRLLNLVLESIWRMNGHCCAYCIIIFLVIFRLVSYFVIF